MTTWEVSEEVKQEYERNPYATPLEHVDNIQQGEQSNQQQEQEQEQQQEGS